MGKVKATSEYETFDEGSYEVNRIVWFTKDDSGSPIYVTQEMRGVPQMVARYRTMCDKENGPPGSITPDKLALLVRAFGGDPTKLPKDDKLKALIVAEKEIANADKTTRVYVGKSGWINRISGMNLPEGDYIFKYAGIASRDEDGNPAWRTWGDRESAIIQLAVDKPDSPYHGAIQDIWLSRDVYTVLRALIPDTYEALLGTAKEELSRLDELAKAAGATIMGEVAVLKEGKAPRIVRSSLRAISPDDVTDATGVSSVGFIEHLYQAIADAIDKKPWRESGAFKEEGKLSAEGVTWAKHKLAPIYKEHDIPKKFAEMSESQVFTVLTDLGRDDLAKLISEGDSDGDW